VCAGFGHRANQRGEDWASSAAFMAKRESAVTIHAGGSFICSGPALRASSWMASD